jgi:hypothetical protein
MKSITDLNRQLVNTSPEITTGIIQRFGGTTAFVAIEGNLVLLDVLDHVELQLGLVAVCAVYGRTGYVLGTIGNVIRLSSQEYEGGFENPNPPDAFVVEDE